MPLTKITAARNEVALSYHVVRGLYFLAVIFAAIIVLTSSYSRKSSFIFCASNTLPDLLAYLKFVYYYYTALLFKHAIYLTNQIFHVRI